MGRVLLKFRWFLLYLASRAGLLLPRTLIPTALAYAVAVRVSDICFVLFRGPREKLIANLERVLGSRSEAERAARRTFRQYAMYIIDLFQVPALGPASARSRMDFHAWDQLEAIVAEERGTIFVTMHFGQWETGAAALAASGYVLSVVARTLEFAPMNSLVQSFRRQMGMNIIPAERAGLGTFRCLARNEVTGMLLDQVDPGEGVKVDFFGADAEMSSAPARIALRTGARLVPAVVIRDAADSCRFVPIVESGLHIEQSGNEEADVEAITQRLAHTFEGFVRSYPDQWFAFKPVWPVESRMAVRGPDFNDRLNHLALELANALFRDLPKPSAYLVARLAGDIAFYLRKNIREDVEDNMRHVLGPEASPVLVKACAQEVFRNVCRYYADLIRIPRTRPEELMRKEMRIIGFDKLQRKMAAGRGIVIATAHFGNPEVATQIGHLLGLNVLVLSEPLNPPAFSDLVHRLRESQGARFEEVGFKAIGKALAHLRAGGTVAVTCDRDIQGTGVPLRFFGTETLMPLGAAELAYRTDAVLAPAYCRRTRKGYDVVFEEPIESAKTGQRKLDAITTTKAMIERMEAWIRSGPGQWMVLERIWEDSGRLKEAREKPTLGSRTAVVDV